MLRAFTFGQCTFETATSRIAPDAEVHFGLLLSLAAGPSDGVPRDALVERLWPTATPDHGRHSLRQAMYRLRQLDVPVRLHAGHVVLDWASAALDVHTLLYGTPERGELVRLGALPFLPGYSPSLGDTFADWLEALRARVATRLRRALADEVLSARNRGRFHDMGHLARALLALDPLNEIGTCALAEALVLEGSKVEGVRLLEDYEGEVGAINPDLQVPVRLLRRRVSEVLDDSLALDRFESPFVGREREFARLRALLREVRGGAAQAVFVTGEAGVGKTRLVDELLRLAALDGATIARYTTSSGDTFTPISTLVSVGRLLLTLPGALGCDQEQLSYIRRLGVPEAVSTWNYTGMAADILYAQLVHAFAELVSAIADEAPLLLVLDDAERLHPTTWRVLVDLWARVGNRSVFFVLAARRLPEWFGSLGARTCERRTQHIPIYAFGRDESLAFLAQWVERNQVPLAPALAQRLAGLSAGNPFHLAELAAHVARGGHPDQVPSGIHELITAQQLALSSATQRVLLAIAVLEHRATTTRVTRLLELPAGEFLAAIEELEASGLVSTSGPALWCRHRLVGQVAIERSRESVLRFTHARAATLLESEADGTDSVELLGDCVTHWEGAGELKRAYDAAMKLGSRLVGMGMGEEAERAFVRAEGIAQDDVDRAAAIAGMIIASHLSARWSSIGALQSRRLALIPAATPTTDEFDELALITAEAELFSSLSVPDTSRLRSVASSTQYDSRLRLRSCILLAILADNFFAGDQLRDVFGLARPLLDRELSAEGLLLSTIFDATIGDRVRARQSIHRVIADARESPDYSWRLLGLRRAAEAALRSDTPEAALVCAAESLALATKLELPVQQALSLERLVHICLTMNCADRALDFVEQLRALERTSGGAIVRQLLFADAMIAWHLDDEVLARSVLSRASSLALSPIPRAAQTLLTIRVAAGLLAEESVSADVVASLADLHVRGRGFGGQDLACDVLVAALRRTGNATRAGVLRRAYLDRWRLEGFAVARGLRNLA